MERLTRDASVAFVGVAAVVLMAVPAGAQSRGASASRHQPKPRARAERHHHRDRHGRIGSGGSRRDGLGPRSHARQHRDRRPRPVLPQPASPRRLSPPRPYARVRGVHRFDDSRRQQHAVSARPAPAARRHRRGGRHRRGAGQGAADHRGWIRAAPGRRRRVERLVLIRAPARRRGVVDPSSEAKHPQGFVADSRADRRRPDAIERLDLRAASDSAASVASSLHRFPVLRRGQLPDDRSVAPARPRPRCLAGLRTALAAPCPGGDWSIRGAMSEGDLSSWNVAGAYASKPNGGPAHRYDFGVSYSTQEYVGGNPAALAAVSDGSRNVGELYAFDEWEISATLSVEYGARYAHYDYLQQRGLLSPKFGVSVEVLPETTVARGARAAYGRARRRGVPRRRAPPARGCRRSGRSRRSRLGEGDAFAPSAAASSTSVSTVESRRRLHRRRQPLPSVGRRSARDDLRPADPRRTAVGWPLLRRRGCGRSRRMAGPVETWLTARLQARSLNTAAPKRDWTWRGDMICWLTAGRIGSASRRRGAARSHHVAHRGHPRNGDARVRHLQSEQRLRAPDRPARPDDSTPASTFRSTRRCRWPLPARSGKSSSACAICSAIPRDRPRSTTNCSSSDRPSASSAESWASGSTLGCTGRGQPWRS